MSVSEDEEFNVAEPVIVDVLEQPTVESAPAPLADIFVPPSGGQMVGASGTTPPGESGGDITIPQ